MHFQFTSVNNTCRPGGWRLFLILNIKYYNIAIGCHEFNGPCLYYGSNRDERYFKTLFYTPVQVKVPTAMLATFLRRACVFVPSE